MSRLAEFKALEAQLAAQLSQLDALKNDDGLQHEIEFEKKLRALMTDYEISLTGIISLLDPQTHRNTKLPAMNARGQRRERAVKTYKNPETGEVVETKSANNKVLRAWKEQHGAEAVEGWLQ